MAKYKPTNPSQGHFLPVFFHKQLQKGTFEYAINHLIDEELDLSHLDVRYQNDETGAPAYDPRILLKVVLLAYSRGITSSREIARCCEENIVFIALSANSKPHFTTISNFVSSMDKEIIILFHEVLLICDEMGLIGREMFAVDGCKLPSNASKGWSGTRDDFKKKCTKLEAAIERIVKRHRESDLTQAQESVKETEEQCIATLTKQVKKIKDWLDDNDDTPDRIRKWHFDITQTPKQRGGEGLQPNSFCKKTSSITYISGSTANRALALLSTVFNQMRSNAPNPCKGVKKFPEKSRTRFLQPEELKRFFKALDAPETPEIIRDYLYLSLFTGGRRSNVLSMQWREIDFRSRLWHIPPDKIVNISKKK